MKIAIIRSCLETLTPRAIKNAQTLAAAGHNVTVLAWDREHRNPKLERRDGYQAYRGGPKAPYGARVLFYLPVWWGFEFWWLMRNRWDVVHAMDFDTVIPAVLAARIKRRLVIYEIVDIYEGMRPLPRILQAFFIRVDRMFMRLASAVITGSESWIKELNGIPNAMTTAIYNSPFDLAKPKDIPAKESDIFTIFYSGALRRSRRLNIDKVIAAIKDIDGIRLVIAGYGDEVEEIKKQANGPRSKVQFIGELDYTAVLEKTMTADLLFALHEPTNLNVRHTCSIKLFEAMMCRKPILANRGTATAEIVEKEKCGILVDGNSIEEIKGTIAKLKENPDLCHQLGANGRRAYEQRYSWEIMGQRLLSLYQKIGSEAKN